MTEVEIKLPVPDTEKIISGLLEMGFHPGMILSESDTYFDNDGEQIRKNGEALRIRQTRDSKTGETQNIITFKGQKMDEVSMTRQELETEIGDAETCLQILSTIGFTPVQPKVMKHRQTFHCGEITACIDHVQGLGSFLELEILIEEDSCKDAALTKIKKILTRLGFQMGDTTRISYLGMLQKAECSKNTP